jgi:hypothetical protein
LSGELVILESEHDFLPPAVVRFGTTLETQHETVRRVGSEEMR